jgi:hypothetical protein
LNNHGPIESLACAMPWNPRHLSSRCSVARYSRKFSQGNYDGSFERNRGFHRFQRVFEKSPFYHISPTMFPHSSFQTAGANRGSHTVSRGLTKVPGGNVRSAELETARGRRFWSVYIAKTRSKNAKEIRVDAASGQIFAVQTERPGDQAEEPPKKPLRDSLATKVLIYG